MGAVRRGDRRRCEQYRDWLFRSSRRRYIPRPSGLFQARNGLRCSDLSHRASRGFVARRHTPASAFPRGR